MKTTIVLTILLALFAFPVFSHAELDLDKEVITIPDTHNTKPFIWHVARNPKGSEASIEQVPAPDGNDSEYRLTLKSGTADEIDDLHVFITDSDLHIFRHLRPVKVVCGVYKFSYEAPKPGKYHFEIVFKAADGWVDLSREVMLKGTGKGGPGPQPGDEDYDVSVKRYPKKIYAEHTGTLLFEIKYKGKPVTDLEKTDGLDMQVASWDRGMKEFVFAVPKQNPGGPEVGVSLVFMRPGEHTVFAEFRHKGATRTVDFVVDALEEPKPDNAVPSWLNQSPL